MPTREDDNLDMLAGLFASRDDAPAGSKPKQGSATQTNTRKATAQTATPAQPSAQQAAAGAAQATPPTVAKSGKGFVWFMFLLLLIVIGAGVWLGQQVLELQKKQAASNNALQLERSRVESISAQVHETDSSFVETGNVLDSKFKFFDSEIRKLWDVANKRNRQAIDANKQLLNKTAKSTQAKLSTLESQQTAVAKATDKVRKQLAAENTALRATVEAQNEQLLIMEGELELLQQRLQKVPNDLAIRVAENEEVVQAIDASRQYMLKRLTKLQQQVESLQRPAQAAP